MKSTSLNFFTNFFFLVSNVNLVHVVVPYIVGRLVDASPKQVADWGVDIRDNVNVTGGRGEVEVAGAAKRRRQRGGRPRGGGQVVAAAAARRQRRPGGRGARQRRRQQWRRQQRGSCSGKGSVTVAARRLGG